MPAHANTNGVAAAYRPVAQVRNTLRVKWYRCPVDPAVLRELMRRSDWRGAVQSVGHLLLWGATGAATCVLFVQQLWVPFVLALVAHGTVGSFFKGAAIHELGHGTVFRTKWLNGFFARIFCVLGFSNIYDFKMSHSYHHRYTLYPEVDREVVLPQDPTYRFFYLLQLFTVNITGGYQSSGIWTMLRQYGTNALDRYPKATGCGGDDDGGWMEPLYGDAPGERRKAVWWARLRLLYLTAAITVPILLGVPIVALLLLAHLGIGTWLRWLVGGPTHCGLRENVPDFRMCVRSNTLDPISEFLYWGMNWHIEHHMYAGVPFYNLAKLYRVIKDDMPQPRTLWGSWREMLDIWKRQQEDPSYQFDTPLPPTAHPPVLREEDAPAKPRTRPQDVAEMEQAIGDMAPAVDGRLTTGG